MQKGFSLLFLLIVVAGVTGVGYWYIRTGGLPAGEDSLEGADVPYDVVTERTASSTPEEQRGSFTLGYKGTQLIPLLLSRDVALIICGFVGGEICVWDAESILGETHEEGDAQSLITIEHPYSKMIVTRDFSMPITFTDAGTEGNYHVYLVHRNLIGEIDGIHEAHIVRESGTEKKTLIWNGDEVFMNEYGVPTKEKLPKGHYELKVVNIDTGAIGEVASFIHLIDGPGDLQERGGSNIAPYAIGTPVMDSFWDGRGIFFDGKENVDTAGLTFRRDEIAVYRGVDNPEKGEMNVLVFFRRPDQVVIVTANVEIFTFADQTLTIEDLMTQVKTSK